MVDNNNIYAPVHDKLRKVKRTTELGPAILKGAAKNAFGRLKKAALGRLRGGDGGTQGAASANPSGIAAPSSLPSPVVRSAVPAEAQGKSFAELSAGRPESVVGGTRLGATDASGARVRNPGPGNGTFSTVSTPQSALDYNAQVANASRNKRASDVRDNLANREASFQRDLMRQEVDAQKKEQDSMLFQSGIGRYRANAKQDKAFMGKLLKANAESLSDRQIIQGNNSRAEGGNALNRLNADQQMRNDVISQNMAAQKLGMDAENKTNKFNLDMLKEGFDQSDADRKFNQGEERLANQRLGTTSQIKSRQESARVASLNQAVNRGNLNVKEANFINKVVGDMNLTSLDKSRQLGQLGSKGMVQDPAFMAWLNNPETDIEPPQNEQEMVGYFQAYLQDQGRK